MIQNVTSWLHEHFSTLYKDTNFKFSIIALQEIWNIPKNVNFSLPGYHDLCFKICDESGLNSSAGDGVTIWVDSSYDYEFLDDLSIFEPHVYESIFIKIKVPGKQDTILGNIYRPNTAPLADLTKALEIHNSILQKIQSSAIYIKCDVTLCSDLNIDLLQFSQHNKGNQYLESLLSASFLPIITNLTRIHKRSATLINHIFSNKKANHYDSGIIISHISDHFPVFYIEE